MSIFFYIASNAQYRVYRYKDQTILIPVEKKKELEGKGSTFIDSLKFETIKGQDGKDIEKAWVWAGNCGKVFIDDPKVLELKGKQASVRVKMESFDSCLVKSWEKF